MPDNDLTQILADLEKQIGPERLSALRREAARRQVSILTLISEAIVEYSKRLASTAA